MAGLAPGASAQQAPALTKDQRALLLTVLAAVDAAAAAPETDAQPWQTHLLRASDGSHYIALSLASTAGAPIGAGPHLVYVRLATAQPAAASATAEQSAIREWLSGSRTDPRLLPPRRGFAVGEMPAMGAGAIGVRGGASVGSADLKLLEFERERTRERKEDQERQRRVELEGGGKPAGNLLPFEDFEIVRPSAFADGTPAIERALTTGPGAFHLYVAWVDASAKPAQAAVRVAKRALSLPPASANALGLGSIIVADRVGVRDTPYLAVDQRAHPYAIGLTEITPARDRVFTRDQRLSVAFQVINPSASATGKPEVSVSFRIVRLAGLREETAATLTPLRYDGTTLPPDFDLRLGHPVLAAMSVPLSTLARGEYRLQIAVTDHLSGEAARSSADFRIAATLQSLLAEAPPLGRAFRRDAAFEPAALDAVVGALTPLTPSPALARALEAARQRRFIDLMRDDPVGPGEQATRAALTAMALFSFGDASAVIQIQGAARLGAPPAPLAFLTGASRAAEGRDADATAAWQTALDAGLAPAAVLPLLTGAYLRQNNAAPALQAARDWRAAAPDGDWGLAFAAASLGAGRAADAIPILEARLAAKPDDVEASWLLTHALFALVVADQADGAILARFRTVAEAYVATDGPHAALARDWLTAAALVPAIASGPA